MGKQWVNFITYRPFPWDYKRGGDYVMPKGIVIGPFNYDEQNGYPKF